MTFGEFTPSDSICGQVQGTVFVKEIGATLSKIPFYGLVHAVFILSRWFDVRLLKKGKKVVIVGHI